MTDKGPGGMDVELNRLLGAIDTARVYSPNEGDLAIVTLRMDEALALADALRCEKARMDFIEQNALFIALDGRTFSHCQMGASRSCIDAAIAALAPNAELDDTQKVQPMRARIARPLVRSSRRS